VRERTFQCGELGKVIQFVANPAKLTIRVVLCCSGLPSVTVLVIAVANALR
jgi:hypothetical protein